MKVLLSNSSKLINKLYQNYNNYIKMVNVSNKTIVKTV